MNGERVTIIIGLISDTHGLLREEAVAALRGCERIIHAGDIGSPAVIDGLREVAPTTVIRGNVDSGSWAETLPSTTTVEVGDKRIHVLHNLRELDLDPAAAGIDVVVSGHSHQPGAERRGGVLYVNPGSAGPRRFRLPVVLARLRLAPRGMSVRHVDLLAAR